MQRCTKCQVDVPVENVALHELRCFSRGIGLGGLVVAHNKTRGGRARRQRSESAVVRQSGAPSMPASYSQIRAARRHPAAAALDGHVVPNGFAQGGSVMTRSPSQPVTSVAQTSTLSTHPTTRPSRSRQAVDFVPDGLGQDGLALTRSPSQPILSLSHMSTTLSTHPTTRPSRSRRGFGFEAAGFGFSPSPRGGIDMPDSFWSCPSCTFSNPVCDSSCSMCGTARFNSGWRCLACTFLNSSRDTLCSICETSAPAERLATDAVATTVRASFSTQHSVESPRFGGEPARRERARQFFTAMLSEGTTVADEAVEPSITSFYGLPVHTVTREEVVNCAIEGDECPICLQEYEFGDLQLTMPCCHRMHMKCAEPWLSRHSTCPTCRHATGT